MDEPADTSATTGFLADVIRACEAASHTNNNNDNKYNRVFNLRFGFVLIKRGGTLEKLAPVSGLGVGGVVGSGIQYLSFV